MSVDPRISFHVPGQPGPSGPGTLLWGTPLSGSAASGDDAADWTVGDYFLAARRFLAANRGAPVRGAVRALTGNDARIQAIDISLEKHGAFYHPLKIRVDLRRSAPIFLVANGAVKEPGLGLVETEYHLLDRLARQAAPGLIPRVFGVGSIVCEKGTARFFLGQWFDGFCEFHVTRTAHGIQVALWEDDGSLTRIPWDRSAAIYQAVACILTTYYDPDTGNEIYPWHHAAGDFVAAPEKKGFAVRLITVRGYGPLTRMETAESAPGVQLLIGMLFYFLNLTVRMRLDRLDGTGPMVFLPDIVLDAAINGVFQALDTQPEVKTAFAEFLRSFNPSQLAGIIEGLVDAWHPDAAETDLVKENLNGHCEGICHKMKTR